MNRWHRLLALVVGAQLSLWLLTGLGLGLLPTPPQPKPRAPETLAVAKLVLPEPQSRVGSVGAITLLGKTRIMVDGEVLTPLTQGEALWLLNDYFPGQTPGPLERQDHGWQTSLPGGFLVTLGDDGKVRELVHWLQPWLLRLHFMHWWGSGKDFNQPLVQIAALLANALVLSGFWMAGQRLRQRRRKGSIRLDGFALPELAPGPGTLAQRLEQAGMPITGPCDGGGRCGDCVVRVDQSPVSQAERRLLTDQALEQGLRLACQQSHCSQLTAVSEELRLQSRRRGRRLPAQP
ncbi:2Fe-2S iron-sulfur cluster-binding protein [Gallaecimonas xiamenensis]|uniref:Na+-transporting NADH:ubiquinone oxidoreductase subunit NqrF n=1 Tax=Gallaecimonas xiamenensis 3-C-1 TaxID=745411 RepID=K2JKS6_9GAMM|nr:2Fe-2S iron-sulfur cluster-binding protein [Gallaecimonas xiamenensis]EKE75923.1 Na+-transporting NADH:ubiquinone oxidoreductase subunit NqrF [Gallaecimonas xiamenensis 3-C-1]